MKWRYAPLITCVTGLKEDWVGRLGVGLCFLGRWECVLHYMQNYMQSHNYKHCELEPLHLLLIFFGEAHKLASDFLKLTVRIGKAVLVFV